MDKLDNLYDWHALKGEFIERNFDVTRIISVVEEYLKAFADFLATAKVAYNYDKHLMARYVDKTKDGQVLNEREVSEVVFHIKNNLQPYFRVESYNEGAGQRVDVYMN